MSIDDFAATVAVMASSGSWPDLTDAAHRSIECVGGAGTSLGVLEHGRVRQFSRGFDARLDARYASLDVSAPLPGLQALRSGVPELLEDEVTTLSRFPAAAPILGAGGLEAAACLPLLLGDHAIGFLAAHYRGPPTFTQVEVSLLAITAAVCAGVAARLRDGGVRAENHLESPSEAPTWQDVQQTTANRAVIEQAKGMLMQRFEIDSDAAWNVLRRLSSLRNVKVRELAAAVVAGDALPGLSERFIGQTAHHINGQGSAPSS